MLVDHGGGVGIALIVCVGERVIVAPQWGSDEHGPSLRRDHSGVAVLVHGEDEAAHDGACGVTDTRLRRVALANLLCVLVDDRAGLPLFPRPDGRRLPHQVGELF
jgi:hypothetical protein